MNASDLKVFIRQISKEKDLDIEVVKDAVEQAIISASKRNLTQFEQYGEARVELDAETGELRMFIKKSVARLVSNPRTQINMSDARKIKPEAEIDDVVEVEVDPSIFGRIAAQSAKQVVLQKLKDAERRKVHDEYAERKGDIYTGVVQRFEKRDYIVNIGKSEALLPRNETPPGSHYRLGDRIKVVLVHIDPEAKGPVLRVSRNTEELVSKLFEQEVPEIADGTVKIVNIVREPGARTKLAVESTSNDVDPVGACVGVKGSRVQMIVRELENEKIDIVPFSTNIKQFITAALVPAQIQAIEIDEHGKKADVIVKQGNLSLAIGKRGQNAKLAAKLTGWKLDIHSEGEDEKRASADSEHVQWQYLEDFITQIDRADNAIREAIYASRFNSVQGLATATAEELSEILDGDTAFAQEIIDGASEYMEALREMTRSNYGEEDKLLAGENPSGEQTTEASNPDSESSESEAEDGAGSESASEARSDEDKLSGTDEPEEESVQEDSTEEESSAESEDGSIAPAVNSATTAQSKEA